MTFSLRSFASVAPALSAPLLASRAADTANLALARDGLRIEWAKSESGWCVKSANIRTPAGERSLPIPTDVMPIVFL